MKIKNAHGGHGIWTWLFDCKTVTPDRVSVEVQKAVFSGVRHGSFYTQ